MSKTLQDLLVDKEFAVKLFEQKTEEDVRKLFSSEGVEITDENLKNLKTLCSKIVDKLKDIDDNELKNVTGGGDFLDVAHHLTSRTNNSNAITGALVGLGLSIFYNYKDKKSFGKKAANVAMSTLAGAIIGYGSGTGQEAIQKKWFENSSFIIMSNYYNNE